MIISLGVPTSCADHVITFVTNELPRNRTEVVCYESLKKAKDPRLQLDKLIIPYGIDGCDYSFEKMIEHVRIDSDKNIARTPIVVHLKEEEFAKLGDSKSFIESWYNNIAVSFSPDPAHEDFILEIDKKAWGIYQEQSCKEPYSTGRHDKSNHWGAFLVLLSLKSIEKGNTHYITGVEKIQKQLVEETYYRKLIQEIESQPAPVKCKKEIQTEISSLCQALRFGKILIIEDQLQDGWEDTYRAVFSKNKKLDLLFANDPSSARRILQETTDIELVLLDIRLGEDCIKHDQDEVSLDVDSLSGVKLAKEIRSILPTVPIIAATASNKSWTLEALLELGINSYWVKASPDYINTIDLGLENILDLYKKINQTILWSQRTRFWQDELYRVAQIVKSSPNSEDAAKRLNEKARSLHALLFRSVTPFSNDLSHGMQMNTAFLIIYSCMNDVITWVCSIENNCDGTAKWYLEGALNDPPVVERKKDHNENLAWFVQNDSDYSGSVVFPDKKVAKYILIKRQLNFSQFDEMSKIRNGLPLIHGKIAEAEVGGDKRSVSCVTDKHITTIIKLLASLVDDHLKCLTS